MSARIGKIDKAVMYWNKEFPMLTKMGRSLLLMKADPILIGLRIMSEPGNESYRIYIEIYPLWKENSLQNNAVLIFEEMYDLQGSQLFIKYDSDKDVMDEVVYCAKCQFEKFFSQTIDLEIVNGFIDYAFSEIVYKFKHNPLFLSRILELKLGIATYMGNQRLISNTRKKINKEIRNWDKLRFKLLFHKTIEEWKASLCAEFEDRDKFIWTVEENSNSEKFKDLFRATIIDQGYKPRPEGFLRRLLSKFT